MKNLSKYDIWKPHFKISSKDISCLGIVLRSISLQTMACTLQQHVMYPFLDFMHIAGLIVKLLDNMLNIKKKLHKNTYHFEITLGKFDLNEMLKSKQDQNVSCNIIKPTSKIKISKNLQISNGTPNINPMPLGE